MERLFKVLDNALKLDIDKLMRKIYADKELQILILDPNRNRQLFQQGVNAEGKTLASIGGPYTTATIEGTSQFEGKRSKGLPTDHITLFDEGDFYATFRFLIEKDGFEILADPQKDETNLFDRWGKEILGLNEDSIAILQAIVRERLIPLIRASLIS